MADNPCVRIYEEYYGAYADVSHLLVSGGRPVTHQAENRPGSATFSLRNDYTKQGHNLLTDYTFWTSQIDIGPKAIHTGMYVEIKDGPDGPVLFDGRITTITSKAEVVDIEIGDGIAFLGKQGTTIRRNFYGESSGFQWFDSAVDEADKVYLDLGANEGIVDTNQVYWAFPKEEVTTPTKALTTRTMGRIKINAQEPKFIREIDIRVVRSDTDRKEFSFNVDVSVGSETLQSFVYTMTLGGTSGTGFKQYWIPITFNPPILAKEMYIDITCDKWDHLVSFGYDDTKTDRGSVVIKEYDFKTGELVGEVETPGLIASTITYDEMRPVQVGTGSSSSRIYPANEEKEMREGSPSNRGRVFVTVGEVPTADIMQFIGRRTWHRVQVGGRCSATVGLARSGGGYALDYLQSMADVVDGTGRRHAFISRDKGMNLLIGDRYNVDDEPKMRIVYGGDKTEDDQVPFVSFNPTMTLKNRPAMVTLRAVSATGGSNSPTIVTLMDLNAYESNGAPVETVSSTTSVASDRDAVREAYGLLTSNALDSWEGSVVLPGIVNGLIERAGDYAGSGIPIRITDSRNGIFDYPARVRQVSHNWNDMTTTVTVGNYDMAVLNKISDTVAMASKGNAEAFSASSSATAYNTQYLWDFFSRTSNIVVNRDKANTLQIAVERQGSESIVEVVDKSIGLLPDGSAVIQGRITSALADVDPYGAVAYIVNGERVSIGQDYRPDFYIGQTLVISLTFEKVN